MQGPHAWFTVAIAEYLLQVWAVTVAVALVLTLAARFRGRPWRTRPHGIGRVDEQAP